MKKKLFTFFCTMAVLLLCQSAWAAAGDTAVYRIHWANSDLNSLAYDATKAVNYFSKLSGNGLEKITIKSTDSPAQNIKYKTDGSFYSHEHLDMGTVKKGGFNYVLAWEQQGVGFTTKILSTGARLRSYGGYQKAWCYWGNGAPTIKYISTLDSYSTMGVSSTNFTASDKTMDFKYGRDGVEASFLMAELDLDMEIVPDDPTWKSTASDMKVTVNQGKSYHHDYSLAENLNLGNEYFRKDLVYYLVNDDMAKYLFWNDEAHTSFYVIKPGTYKFKAYIEKKSGDHSASVHETFELVITATADPAEQDVAQVFYMVDDKLAKEYDTANHYWTVDLPWVKDNKHYVEYIYAFAGDYQFVKKTTHCLNYLEDTDPASDHFNVVYAGMTDTTEIKIDGGHHSWLEINTVKADNHVTFKINSQKMFDTLATYWSTQEGKDVYWDNNRIRFAHFNSDYSRERKLEITFTGVPDSLIMLYGNNSEWQSSNANMRIEYCVKGAWSTLATINGRPNSNTDEAVRFAYRVPAGANQLRFSYWGAQNLAYIHDLTVTERKGIEMSVAMDSVLEFSGVRKDGGLEIKYPTLSWYNLHPAMYDTLVNDNADRFAADLVGLKTLAFDDFEENHQIRIALKLDSAGVFTTHYMVWNGTADMKEVPGGKHVYGFQLRGIVKYNLDEIEVSNTLPNDTAIVEQGDELLPNPFQVVDTLGKPIPTDSVSFEYSFLPEGNAELDSVTGGIKANCVGYTRVIATLKDNQLIPGGKKDTIYIYTPEKDKNVINWNIPAQIGRGDVLIDLATAVDSTKITYDFNPAFATQIGSENKIQIADTIGDMFVTATASATCDHLQMSDTKIITILDIIKDAQVEIKDSTELKDLLPGDSIENLVIVTDPKTGDTLTTTYKIIPDSAATVVDGKIIVISHAVDPIMVIATTTGDGLKDRIDTIYVHVNHDWEEIRFTDEMPDTMLVGTEYLLGQYIITKSGKGANKLYVADSLASKAKFNQEKRSVTPKDSAFLYIYAVANGNADFHGPDTTYHKVHFVYGVKDIDWTPLGDLSDLRVKDDTVRTSDIEVYDIDGNPITDQVEKSYEFEPTGMAHVTEDGDIVMDQAGEVTVVITTSGPGFDTKVDTLHMYANGYEVSRIEFPIDWNNIHVGDVVSLDGVKVFDQDDLEITNTKVDSIRYSIQPVGAGIYDPQTNSFVVLSADSFQLVCNVFGSELIPSPTVVYQPVGVQTYDNIQIILPAQPQGEEYLPGDTINLNDIKVLDENGNDITDLADIVVTWEPKENAHLDENGNLVVDKAGELDIKVEVSGEGLETTEKDETITVDQLEVASMIFPDAPEGGYHVGDVINTDDIILLDAQGNDITSQADITYSFIPTDGAHLDQYGNIVIDKSGEVTIQVNVQGDMNVAATTQNKFIEVKKYDTEKIVVPAQPEEDYTVGDKIVIGDIHVYDKDGNDITEEGTVVVTWDPEDAAHINGNGDLVFDKPGVITVSTCFIGEGVKEMCIENSYIVRHDETGCQNLLVQVWDDVLAINNNKEEHIKRGIGQFVRYQWYREEALLAGETAQDYHISAGEFKDSAFYYAYAYDEQGKEYLMCQILVKESSQPAASQSFKIYPSIVEAGGKYTVEVDKAGKIFITTSNGNAVSNYQVAKGMNEKTAPAAAGVYMLQFIPNDGKNEVLKLIVK